MPQCLSLSKALVKVCASPKATFRWQGENAKAGQELLRHASLKVTTDVYMQAGTPQKREAQSKLVKMVMEKGRAEQASA